LTTAENEIESGGILFSEPATELSSGDYGQASLDNLFGSDFVSVIPVEELLLGAAVSF
jgi:hypothetical protein